MRAGSYRREWQGNKDFGVVSVYHRRTAAEPSRMINLH